MEGAVYMRMDWVAEIFLQKGIVFCSSFITGAE